MFIRLFFMTLCCLPNVSNAELVQQFKDPAFSSQGWSTHALTINAIEKSRADQLVAEKQAAIDKAQAEQLNTPLNRFVSLFQSQVYSQLATQLSNNLFQNTCKNADGALISGCVNPSNGTFVLDGNTVTWNKTSSAVQLTVVDTVGNRTEISVPIASFAF